MSRRKQSNPKPFKRSAEDDEDDVNLSAKRMCFEDDDNGLESPEPSDLNGDALSPRSPLASAENEVGGEANSKHEEVRDSDSSNVFEENNNIPDCHSPKGEKHPPSEEDIAKMLNVPMDVIRLRRIETTFEGNIAIGWTACSVLPLPKGCSIGSFQGCEVSEGQVRTGQLILQFIGDDNDRVLMNVTQSTGAWLALLRRPIDDVQKNANVYLENGRIWCEIIKDIDIGTEIVGTFTIHQESATSSKASQKTEAKVIVETPSNENSKEKTTHAALIYGCPFCGVRFSSPRTLEAHIMIYCSKKPSDLVFKTANDTNGEESSSKKNSTDGHSKSISPISSKTRNTDAKEDGSTPEKLHPKEIKRERATPSPEDKTQMFSCSSCYYSCDKPSSLKRHRRMHSRTDEDDDVEPSTSNRLPVPNSEMYCKECNIQFSSPSTYAGHKEYYCPKRERLSSSECKSSSGKFHCENCNIFFTSESTFKGHNELYCPKLKSAARSQSQHSPQSRKPNGNNETNFLPVPSLQATHISPILPGQTAVILAAPVIGPNGVANVAFNMPTVIYQPMITSATLSPPEKREAHTQLSPIVSTVEETNDCKDSPLDLSTKKDRGLKTQSPLLSTNVKSDESSDINKFVLHSPIKEEKQNTNVNNFIRSESETPPPSEQCSSPKNIRNSSQSPNGTAENHGRIPMNLFPLHAYPPLIQVQQMRVLPPQLNLSPKSNVSKCTDCNIVFYKHANFLAHKEHYCSGKKIDCSSESDDSNNNYDKLETELNNSEHHSPKVKMSPPLHDALDTKLHMQQTQIYRYYCSPCQIKFSSASNLKAHKDFYCPSDKTETTDAGNADNKSDEDRVQEKEEPKIEQGIFYTCERCGGKLSSSRLVKLHLCYCRGPCTRNQLVKCRYCDFVTQTEAKLSDHIKLHVPSKSYRCSLCGYRGNTVRGMRMHGKVHQDEGVSYSDDNVVAYEEPPLIPVQSTNHLNTTDPMDVEAELLRLKNEPYKRRRSRKSAERSDDGAGPSSSPSGTPQRCHLCGETFEDSTSFFMHMQMHGILSMHAMDTNQQCKLCDYKPSTLHDLIRHVHTCHRQLENSQTLEDKQHEVNTSSDATPTKKVTESNLFEVSIKQEPRDNSSETVIPNSSKPEQTVVKTEPAEDSEVNGDGRSETPPKPQTDQSNKKENAGENKTPPIKEESRVKDDCHNEKDSGILQPISDNTAVMTHSASQYSALPLYGLPISNPLMAQYMTLQTFPGVISSPTQTTYESRGPKYCRHCDISFNYLSSFLAHKKYYCTARASEELNSSAKA